MPDELQHPSGPPNPKLRVSDAEREHVIAHLHRSTEEGRLELAEFNERSQAVYQAKTYGDLQILIEDLPDYLTPRSALAPGGTGAETAHTPTTLEIIPKASNVRKKGEWLVPRFIQIKSSASYIKLDFTEAIIGTREIDIHVEDKASRIVIVLPREGAYANDNISLKAASVRNRCNSAKAGGFSLNITGKISSGSIVIRRKYRFLWWEF